MQKYYSQTRIKETHRAVRKEFLLSIVSFISCSIHVESLSCIKAEGENVSYIRMFLLSVFLLSEFDCMCFFGRVIERFFCIFHSIVRYWSHSVAKDPGLCGSDFRPLFEKCLFQSSVKCHC